MADAPGTRKMTRQSASIFQRISERRGDKELRSGGEGLMENRRGGKIGHPGRDVGRASLENWIEHWPLRGPQRRHAKIATPP